MAEKVNLRLNSLFIEFKESPYLNKQQANELRDAGYAGGFTRGNKKAHPEIVVWDTKAIIQEHPTSDPLEARLFSRKPPRPPFPDLFDGNEALRREVERQMAAVVEIRDDQGRLLAPNGKPSKLNQLQWKATRTPFFKRWFGNWELMQKQVSLLRSEVVPFGNLAEATEWAKANLVGSYQNIDTGESIAVSGNAIKKYLSQKATDKSTSLQDHLAALPALPKLIETAVLGETHPDSNQGSAVKEIQRFYGVIRTIDGVIQRVKLTVKVYTGRNLAYTYEVSDIETLGGSPTVSGEESVISNRTPSVSMATLLRGARNNNGEVWDTSFSKVVDENGEPRVVVSGHANIEFYDRFDPKASVAGGFYATETTTGGQSSLTGTPPILHAFSGGFYPPLLH